MTRDESRPTYPQDLDSLDRQILRLLRDDGRRSNSDMGRVMGVSEPTVRKRLDRLRDQGVLKIIGVLDPPSTGFPVYAMIGIRVLPGTGRDIGQRLAVMDCVANVTYITGRWDIWIEVMLESNKRLYEFLGVDLADMDGILTTESFLVLAIEKFNYTWELPEPDADGPPAPACSPNPAVSTAATPAADRTRRQRRTPGSWEIDDLDRQILRMLQDDGRRPNVEIARALGISEPTVRKRLERLRESGVVRIIGLLNPAATGFLVDVFVGVKVRHGHVRRVAQHVASLGCVTFVGYTTGPFDLLVEAMFRDNAALLTFLSDTVGGIEGVVATETLHILAVDKFKYMWDLPERAVGGERRPARSSETSWADAGGEPRD